MPQNQAVQAAALAGGGIGFLNTDAAGNLKTVVDAGASEPVANSSGNVAAASAVATLPAAAAKTTYISGLSFTATGATAAASVTATVTGLAAGTLSFTFTAPAGATLACTPLNISFTPPLPASAVNTAVVVTLPSLGAGNTNAVATAWGYQQ